MEDITLRKAIEFAITVEQMGHECYERLARRFSDDKEISEVFAVLAKDEVVHEKQLEKLLESVPAEEPQGYAEKYGYLRAMSLSEFFSSREGLTRALESVKSEGLDGIIKMEKEHMVSVMRYMVTGAKMRGLGDRVPQPQ